MRDILIFFEINANFSMYNTKENLKIFETSIILIVSNVVTLYKYKT